jgi:hypothetical protein
MPLFTAGRGWSVPLIMADQVIAAAVTSISWD